MPLVVDGRLESDCAPVTTCGASGLTSAGVGVKCGCTIPFAGADDSIRLMLVG